MAPAEKVVQSGVCKVVVVWEEGVCESSGTRREQGTIPGRQRGTKGERPRMVVSMVGGDSAPQG